MGVILGLVLAVGAVVSLFPSDSRRVELRKHWKVIVAFSLLGLAVACAFPIYLFTTYPNRNPTAGRVFDFLCPWSFLTLVYLDKPTASTAQYEVVWVFVALINAATYGLIGALVVRLLALRGAKDNS